MLLMSAVAGAPLLAQAPAPGVITGQVVDADSGRGIAAAVVRIGPHLTVPSPSGEDVESLSAYSGNMRYVITDNQGRFAIRNVAAGTYALVLQTNGYVLSAYGHQRPGGVTREIVLEKDQRIDNVVLKAWRNGAIAGVMTDEAGEPMPGVLVRALRREFVRGRAVLTSTFTSSRTDDRGEYRLGGLTPGDYAVVVASPAFSAPIAGSAPIRSAVVLSADGFGLLSARGLTLPSAAAATSMYPTTFYPSVPDATRAGIISLRSGETRAGVDIAMRPVAAVRVSGTVVAPDGTAGGMDIALLPAWAPAFADARGFELGMTSTSDDGRFVFLGVPEGEHVIAVTRGPARAAQAGTTTTLQAGGQSMSVTSVTASGVPVAAMPAPTVWARMPLVVGNRPVTGVTVTLAHGARLTGRIDFDGTSPLPPGGFGAVSLIAAGQGAPVDVPAGRLAADRSFETSQYPPGSYFVNVSPVGGKWSLRSIVVNGKDALRTPLTIGADNVAGAVVTFTDRPAGLSGEVHDRNGTADGNATVALFPVDTRAWIDAGMTPRLLRVADTSSTGHIDSPP